MKLFLLMALLACANVKAEVNFYPPNGYMPNLYPTPQQNYYLQQQIQNEREMVRFQEEANRQQARQYREERQEQILQNMRMGERYE